jgi:hypothetical protein
LLSQILVVAVAVVATAVVIQVQTTAQSGPAPVIAAAQPNAEAQSLTIQGVNFGDALSEVTLGLTPLAVTSWTSTAVVTDLPAYEAGTYLLVLKRADGIFSNSLDLSIGAVGPMGPAGPQGDPGPVARATDTLLGFGGGAGDLGEGAGGGADAVTRGFEGETNTAYGTGALANLEASANNNAAFGRLAAGGVTTGNYNLAFGSQALQNTTTGINNTGIGSLALFRNVGGRGNVAIGTEALSMNTGGVGNIAIGTGAGINAASGSHNIFIGSRGMATDEKVIRIGVPGFHTSIHLGGKIHGDGSGLTGVTAVYQ